MAVVKKVLLIVNPCSGKTSKRKSAEEIISMFPQTGYEFTVKKTERSGHATELVRQFAAGHDLIVCAGGDGTLNETINGMMEQEPRVPVGYIPMGSTNDFATTLGIPSEPQKAIDIIVSGHMNWYDIGQFNNRYFQYVASFGACTKASYATSQKLKNIFGHAAYIMNGLTEWKDIKPIPLRIEYDGNVIEDEVFLGAVSNSTSVAGLFKFDTNRVRLDDGTFEILLVRKMKNLLEAPVLLHKIRKMDYDGKQIFFTEAKSVKITSPNPIAWTLDGEYGGESTETNISNLCRSIRIYSPENPLFSTKCEAEETTA
ncbi:MAG: YegS/Rv2252/BmrU family lipid kinase [Clostridia bacterium]|nr:YegS/Rv2252/BmrU family lipid kinase [Clostridia bacterium]